ncbi:MAG TPA: SDR family oxidoreductase [Spirochaetota bacterium]|jgi:3-oxoacyl-[acyl-carrier protein] reductase|nr:MAG: Gluconate 5-dehydrogenase [Spirochaetes bacterium ADurb.Bin133]HNZ25793.1 SDR family oxidoreductase [Spirochaetota bacterium]HPY86990.1 SDR family oxidoreductase [Spirochaetota bacterium]
MIRRVYRFLKKRLKKVSGFLKKQVPVYIPVFQNQLLQNRVAVITGGTSGIGYEIAKAFLNSGAQVIITSRNQSRVENACMNLQKDTRKKAFGLVLDNADVKTFSNIIEKATCLVGNNKIDILVNNAGVLTKEQFGNMTENEYDQVLATNLKGTYFLSQLFANYMKKNKIRGNILNIASSSSLRPAISPYTISKWGIRGLTLGLAKALIPHGIVVNGLAPGPTTTPMLYKNNSDSIDNPKNPAGRYVTTAEIANMAVVLVSEIGKMIIGDTVYMTGGAGLITFDDITYSF